MKYFFCETNLRKFKCKYVEEDAQVSSKKAALLLKILNNYWLSPQLIDGSVVFEAPIQFSQLFIALRQISDAAQRFVDEIRPR